MKAESFLRAIGDIDDDLIAEAACESEQAAPAVKRKIKPMLWVRLSAACVGVALLGGGLWTMRGKMHISLDDAALEAAPNENFSAADGDAKYDKPINFTQSTADDALIQEESVSLVSFFFREEGVWCELPQSYPDGLPDGSTLVGDYLLAAGAQVQCSAYVVTETTVDAENAAQSAARTAAVTLTGDPGEDALRGLVRTVGAVYGVRYVRIITEDGETLSIGGEVPALGFDAQKTRAEE